MWPTSHAKPIRPIMNLAPFFPSSCDPTKPPALRYSPHESKPTTFCSPGLRNCHAAHGTSSYRTAHLAPAGGADHDDRSEEHTSELQSLMRISYAVFCLKKTNKKHI